MTSDGLHLDDLLALEHRGWDALCRAEGGSFYSDLMTEDAVMVLVNGMVLDRSSVAATLNEAPAWSSYSIEEPRRIAVGETAAALVYRASASRPSESAPFVALMSSVYTLAHGQVRMTLYQQTTITH